MIATWTLVIYLAVGGRSITMDGITSEDTCRFVGETYQENVDARAKFSCSKVVTKRDPSPPKQSDRGLGKRSSTEKR